MGGIPDPPSGLPTDCFAELVCGFQNSGFGFAIESGRARTVSSGWGTRAVVYAARRPRLLSTDQSYLRNQHPAAAAAIRIELTQTGMFVPCARPQAWMLNIESDSGPERDSQIGSCCPRIQWPMGRYGSRVGAPLAVECRGPALTWDVLQRQFQSRLGAASDDVHARNRPHALESQSQTGGRLSGIAIQCRLSGPKSILEYCSRPAGSHARTRCEAMRRAGHWRAPLQLTSCLDRMPAREFTACATGVIFPIHWCVNAQVFGAAFGLHPIAKGESSRGPMLNTGSFNQACPDVVRFCSSH